MASIIGLSQVDFAFGQRLVLKHINLDVEAGTVLGVIGPNGGGKTTLMRLLLGLLEPTRGTIRVAGLDPSAAVRRGDVVGYLPQNPFVRADFPLSVRQLIRLGLTGKTPILSGFSRDDLRHAEELIDKVGMRELADEPIGNLSGGQLQRALMARALVARPRLLLLDEPTTGIDVVGQRMFIEFLMGLKKDMGLTIVLVSHDLRTIGAISDRVACLNVTVHYHDVPHAIPPELALSMFGCDVEALGLGVKAMNNG
jgi:zinc transport system ATP-binding protein